MKAERVCATLPFESVSPRMLYRQLFDSVSGTYSHLLARVTDRRIVFYCAFGERSAMAVQAAQDAGMLSALHVEGGIDAWKKAQGPVAR
jgi:sulfur dioxygenase